MFDIKLSKQSIPLRSQRQAILQKQFIEGKGEVLFANNYHLMADHYSEEETNRSIRKHILIKYGRLLKNEQKFSFESDQGPLIAQTQKNMSQEIPTTFRQIKLVLPKLSKYQESIEVKKLPTNLVISSEDISIAQNLSLYQKATQQLQRTESWELRLKSQLISNSKKVQNVKQNQDDMSNKQRIRKHFRNNRNNQSMDLKGQILEDSTQINPKHGGQDFFLSSEKETPEQRKSKNQILESKLCKLDGKHLILLKNIYAY